VKPLVGSSVPITVKALAGAAPAKLAPKRAALAYNANFIIAFLPNMQDLERTVQPVNCNR
jgi:hypothetical protein